MARNSRVTLGLVMAAALAAFGGIATKSNAQAGDVEWIVQEGSDNTWDIDTNAHFRNIGDTSLSHPVTFGNNQSVKFEQTFEYTYHDGSEWVTQWIPTEKTIQVAYPLTVSGMSVSGNYSFDGGSIHTINSDAALDIYGYGTNYGSASKVTFNNTIDFLEGVHLHNGSTIRLANADQYNNTYFTGAANTTIEIAADGGSYCLNNSAGNGLFTGNLMVESGELVVTGDATISSIARIDLANGTLRFAGSQYGARPAEVDQIIKVLAGSGNIATGTDNTKILTINSTDGDYTGVIDGKRGVTTTGSVSLTKAQAYTGETVVVGGVLTLKDAASIATSSGLRVNSGTFSAKAIDADAIEVKTLAGEVDGKTEIGDKKLVVTDGFAASDPIPDSNVYHGQIVNSTDAANAGSGGLKLDLDGRTHYVALGGVNTYKGATEIETGELMLVENGSIANSEEVVLGANGKLHLAKLPAAGGDAVESTIKALRNGNDVSGTDSVVAIDEYNTLSIVGDGDTTTDLGVYNGQIIGDGDFKLNANPEETFTLASAASYKGDTHLTSGILKLVGSGDLNALNAVGTKVNMTANGVLDVSELGNFNLKSAMNGADGEIRTSCPGDGTFTFTRGNDSFGGDITGGDVVLFDFAGVNECDESKTFTYSGTNSAGLTTVRNGNVILASGGNLENGLFVDSLGDVTVQAGAQVGNGANVTGSGVLESTGAISGGVNAYNGGTFIGAGSVTGDVVINNGTFMNTHSDTTNTLAIDGNYKQNGGSIELGTYNTGGANVSATGTVGINLSGADAFKIYTDGKANTYTLFTGANGITDTSNYLSSVEVWDGVNQMDSNYVVRRQGNSIVLTILNENQTTQYWRGDNGGSVWNSTNTNWSTSDTTTDRDLWQKSNGLGGMAIFGDSGIKDITVVGTQNFDTIRITGSLDRVFSGDSLQLASATGFDYATINADSGRTVEFKNSLVGNTTENLVVNGGGTVILSKANDYDGYTKIQGATTLVLNDDEAAGNGTGNIVFDNVNSAANNATLILGQNNGVYDNQIIDDNTANNNTVRTADNVRVTLSNEGNDYNSLTVVGRDSTLVSGNAGSLSQKSFHELEECAVLEVANGRQDIAGFGGADSSSIDIKSASSLYVHNSAAINYYGSLKGVNTGTFAAAGTGAITLNGVNTQSFTGTFKTGGAVLTLNGADEMNMDINIGSYTNDGDPGTDGTIVVNADRSKQITLNGTVCDVFTGTVKIGQGTLLMTSGAQTLLDNSHSTLVIERNAAMDVTNKYNLHNLVLNGGDVNFYTADGATGTPRLNVDSLDITEVTKFYVNTGVFDDNMDNSGLFDLDAGFTNYIVQAGSVTSGSADLAEVYDDSGRQLTGERYYNISRNGIDNGWAIVDTDSGVNDGSIEEYPTGVFYSQDLKSVESVANTTHVLFDSSNVAVGKKAEINAQLTGDGFEFAGNKSIDINGVNSYLGETVVNMATSNLGVYLNNGSALGNTNLLTVKKGTVYVNGQSASVGAVAGDETGRVNFNTSSADSGGTLTITGQSCTPNSVNEFKGNVLGYGNIVMNSVANQIFSGANSLNGTIVQNKGNLSWAGALVNYGASAYALSVYGGNFTQLDSRIIGNVLVSGSNASFGGYGCVTGNLNITDNGSYLVTATDSSGTLDTTRVTGTATFADNTRFEFSNEAKSLMLTNREYANTTLLDANELVVGANSWYNNGVIDYELGIIGTAHIVREGDSLVYKGLDAPTNPSDTIKKSWNNEGINVDDIVNRSNIGDVAYQTVIENLWKDPSPISTDKVLNARYANSEFMGHVFETGDYQYTKKEVLSVFNYDSGYTATLPVQAALDTGRSFGQGLKNRVNNLRAARTIMADMYSGFGYYQPMGAYGNTIVQDAFGYGVPAYLGTAYYDPYTGMAQGAAPIQPQYGYNYGYQQQQPVYGYGQQYVPGYASTNIWAGGVGSWTKQKTSKGGIGGYTYDAGGLMVGIDHIAGDFLFGAAFGYSHGKLEDKEAISSDSKIHAYAANLYADYNHASGVNAMLFGGFAWTKNKINRTVAGYRTNGSSLYSDYGRENSKYNGHTMYLGTNVSYDWLPTDRLTVSPSIGVEYYQARGKAHNRNLVRNSGVVLSDRVSAVRGHSLSAPIDVTVTYDVVRSWDTKLSLIANAGYAYEFHNKGPKGHLTWNDVEDSPVVSFYGRKPGRNGWNFGGGARFQKKNISFDVKYDYAHRKDARTHRVGANIGWEF